MISWLQKRRSLAYFDSPSAPLSFLLDHRFLSSYNHILLLFFSRLSFDVTFQQLSLDAQSSLRYATLRQAALIPLILITESHANDHIDPTPPITVISICPREHEILWYFAHTWRLYYDNRRVHSGNHVQGRNK
jgi:hypothetical protein